MSAALARGAPRSRRRLLEDAIEAAIAELDALDGDPDAEPTFGWTLTGAGCLNLQPGTASRALDEAEETNEDGSDIGATDNGIGDVDGMIQQFPFAWGGYGFAIEADGTPDDFESGERACPTRRGWRRPALRAGRRR